MLEDVLVTPVVNLGGTSREALVAGYTEALDALRKAEEKLRDIAPHGRDYPGNAPACLSAARQHGRRLGAIGNVIREISTIAERIA